MPFKETEEGQTQYCEGCEEEARENKGVYAHTCGKSTPTEKEGEWEKEFDDRFTLPNHPYKKWKMKYPTDGGGKNQYPLQFILIENIKSFIKETLHSKEKEIYEKIKKQIKSIGAGLSINGDDTEFEKGYYGCRADILSLLDDKEIG